VAKDMILLGGGDLIDKPNSTAVNKTAARPSAMGALRRCRIVAMPRM